MQRLEVSGAVRPIYVSLGVKRLMYFGLFMSLLHSIPFRHSMHFFVCVTLDLNSLSSVPLLSKISPRYLYSSRWRYSKEGRIGT